MDGVISGLNAAMATALGRPAEQCLGRGFGDLWPANHRISAESLVVAAAGTKTVAMGVLESPGRGGAPVACLIEARQVSRVARSHRRMTTRAMSSLAPFATPRRASSVSASWSGARVES
ncbi:PAS domain-containing protein [Streptomyces sp. NPDC001156]